jgi:zinc finger MYM-type protein 2/3/4
MLVISNVESLAANQRGRGRPSKTNDASTGSSINLSQLPELRVNLEPLPNLPTKRVRLTNRMVSTGTYAGLDMDDFAADSPPLPPPRPPPRELPPKIELRTQVVHMPSMPAQVANAIVQVAPFMVDKEVLCKPDMVDKATQTDAYLQRKIVIPIPVPIYVPTPMHMFSLPLPVPVPLAVPVPVPVFIPTTRNAAPGIMKEIKKIQDKMPTDPFEAELLMMAEMVAGDAKKEDEHSDEEVIETTNHYNDGIENNTSFNEDLVQMALKMASNDYEEPVVDLESAMHTSTINQSQMMDNSAYSHHQMMMMEQQQPQRGQRGRKRQVPAAAPPPVVQNQRANNRGGAGMVAANKRQKREEVYDTSLQDTNREPTEKPDANMCLKYTFGVNAWKQWVMTKNADLEKSTIRRKPFKSEILQLTADELNFSLCLFVKEVRKPNGSEYAPDTIYYLVLGIQQYLFENGRIDNIFTDPYYERFTDCLDEVAKKFSVLYNDSRELKELKVREFQTNWVDSLQSIL